MALVPEFPPGAARRGSSAGLGIVDLDRVDPLGHGARAGNVDVEVPIG
jgi:hypothetical protein